MHRHTHLPPEDCTHSIWKCLHRILRSTTRPTGTPSRRWRRQRSPFFLCYWKVRSLLCHFNTTELVQLKEASVVRYQDLTYRNIWSQIPTLCLSLLDITFIHEGNKTFHDNLVNFEKLVSLWSLCSFCFCMFLCTNHGADFEMSCLINVHLVS